jgi:hypothetical protein
MTTSRTISSLVMVALLHAASTVYGEVPTATDYAACNEEALDALKSGSASPTTKDEARAEGAREGQGAASPRTDSTGKITQSPDPQLEGMDAEGAKNPAYQAAYRSCMRKKGF